MLTSVLNSPTLFRIFQNIIGVNSMRRRFINDYVRPLPGIRILDLGCGTGGLISFFPNQCTYVGVDANARYIKYAKHHFSQRGTFLNCSIGKDPLPPFEAFDFIVAIGLLHHVSDDEALCILQIASQLLKPAGKLFTLDPCFINKQSFCSYWMAQSDRGKFVRRFSEYHTLINRCFEKSTLSVSNHDIHLLSTCAIVEAQKNN